MYVTERIFGLFGAGGHVVDKGVPTTPVARWEKFLFVRLVLGLVSRLVIFRQRLIRRQK